MKTFCNGTWLCTGLTRPFKPILTADQHSYLWYRGFRVKRNALHFSVATK
jgi:hypothetical protein